MKEKVDRKGRKRHPNLHKSYGEKRERNRRIKEWEFETIDENLL